MTNNNTKTLKQCFFFFFFTMPHCLSFGFDVILKCYYKYLFKI